MAKGAKSKPLTETDDISSSSKTSETHIDQLIESKALIMSVFESSPNIINVYLAIRDENKTIIDFECILANTNAKENGITIGDRWLEKYPETEYHHLFKNFSRVVEENILLDIEQHYNYNYNYNYKKFDTWHRVIAKKLNDGLVVTTEDITPRKKAERETIVQHNLLLQTEELAKIGSWEYTIDTEEFLWSDGMYRLFEIEKGSPIKPDIYVEYAVPKDKGIAKKIANAIKENFQAFEETMDLAVDGKVKTIKVKGDALKNEEGEIEKVLGVDVDITETRQSEKKVRELNENLYAMNKDLISLNDELKHFNHIATGNYSEALRQIYIHLETIVTTDARLLSDSARANLRRAQATTQKMKLLTNDISNYLQFHDLGIQKQMINPNSIIKNVLTAMQGKIQDAQATINVPELPSFPADPLLFSHLMHHLVDNAIKFRKLVVAPVIKIHYSHADELNATPGAKSNTAYFILIVTDNGIGFKQEEANKMFELFYQVPTQGKHKGSGMGLAICKKIMEMHGGFIVAEGEPARGASFQCYFPS